MPVAAAYDSCIVLQQSHVSYCRRASHLSLRYARARWPNTRDFMNIIVVYTVNVNQLKII